MAREFAKYAPVTVMTKDGGKKITELYLVNGLLLMSSMSRTGRHRESRKPRAVQISILYNLGSRLDEFAAPPSQSGRRSGHKGTDPSGSGELRERLFIPDRVAR